jgi:FKBP-type peptidyl-prolyl cis-trans isomerase 2
MSSHSPPTEGPSKSGELVLLDYELWGEMGGRTELIDTTREEVAQKAGVQAPEGQTFAPHPHLIGGDYFPGGIEAALVGAKFGEEITREFPPADAFGERDPKLIELFSMHEISRLPEMRREDAELDLGTVLNIRGRRGRVTTLTAARVRVDFNPPFAGRKVTGKFLLQKRIHEPADQVTALIDLTYGRSKEFGVVVEKESITVKVPDRTKFDVSWMAAKPRLIDRIRTQLHPETIKIVEEYVTPHPKKEEKKDDKADEKKEEKSPSKPKSEHASHSHASHAKAAAADADAKPSADSPAP